jgi:hypothetical protein
MMACITLPLAVLRSKLRPLWPGTAICSVQLSVPKRTDPMQPGLANRAKALIFHSCKSSRVWTRSRVLRPHRLSSVTGWHQSCGLSPGAKTLAGVLGVRCRPRGRFLEDCADLVAGTPGERPQIRFRALARLIVGAERRKMATCPIEPLYNFTCEVQCTSQKHRSRWIE